MPKTSKTQSTPSDAHHDHSHAHVSQGARHPEIGEDRRIDFTIAWKVVDEAYQQVIKKYQPHVKTAGFRQGKVPLKLVEQMVGPERLYQEVAEKVVPPAYVEAVKKADAKPISDPEIHPTSMDIGKDWEFHAHIAEKPEVKLGKYQDVVKKAIKEFDKKALEDNKKKETEVKKAAKADKKDDEEQSAVNAKATEKPAKQTEQELKDQKLNAILAAVRDSIKPVIPELLIKQEAQHSLQNLYKQLESYNIQRDSYFKSMGKTEEDVQTEFVGRALAGWQLEVIVDALATDQKIEATDDEVEEFIQKNYPKNQKISATQKVQVQGMLRKQKVFDHLLEIK